MIKTVFITVLFDMDGTLMKYIEGGDIFRSKYFEELPPNKNICDAASAIDGKEIARVEVNGHSVSIVLKTASLSSYLANSPHDVLKEKNISLDKHTSIGSDRRFFIPCGSSKWQKAVSLGVDRSSILIDDYGVNLADWQGPSIKVSRDIEDLKKEMQKYEYCISPDQPKHSIVSTIVSCAMNSFAN